MPDDCPLCRLYEKREIVTPLHYEDDLIIVVDCSSCHVPMGVIKRHTMRPTMEEAFHLYGKLRELFPGRRIDDEQKSIPDHLHWHAR